MSLDDIHVMRGTTCAHLNPSTTPNPPTPTPSTPPPSQMDCDFEQGEGVWGIISHRMIVLLKRLAASGGVSHSKLPKLRLDGGRVYFVPLVVCIAVVN